MKTYLLFPFFILNFLFLPFFSFSQEPLSPSSPTSTEEFSQPSAPSSSPFYEIPEMWVDDSHENNPSLRETDTFQSKFFNMLLILGFLIGFMVIASWSLKRMMKSKITHLNTASHIKILETRYLSPRATLYLVEIHDKTFFIAESPTSITYLDTFPLQEKTIPKN